MAKNFTFTDLLPPENFSGTLQAGGSLVDNHDYFYVVQAVFWEGTNTRIDVGKSLSSTEINVMTTTDDKSIKLEWSPVAGAGGYRVYRSRTTLRRGPEHKYSGCIDVSFNDDTYYDADEDKYIFVDDGTISGMGNKLYQNTSHGKLEVEGGTSADPVSIKDLYDYSVSEGKDFVQRLDLSTYKVNCYITTSTDNYWKDESMTIIFNDGWQIRGTMVLGNKLDEDNTDQPCNIIDKNYTLGSGHYSTWTELYSYGTNFHHYTQDFNPWRTYGSIGLTSYTINGGEVLNTDFTRIRSMSNPGCSFKNVRRTRYDVGVGTGGTATFENCVFSYGSRVFQIGGETVTGRNIIVREEDSMVLLTAGASTLNLINSPFKTSQLSTHLHRNITGTVVNEIFTYNLQVRDEEEQPLENVRVRIYDSSNVLLCDENTDIDGNIPEQELAYKIHTFGELGEASCWLDVLTTDDKTPHRVLIEKSGYETYIDYSEYTASEEQFKSATLKKSVSLMIDKNGQPHIRLNKENIGKNRDILI